MKTFLPLLLLTSLFSCKKDEAQPTIYGSYSGVCSVWEASNFYTTVTVDARDNSTVFLTFADSLVSETVIAGLAEQLTIGSQVVDSDTVSGSGTVNGESLMIVLNVEKDGKHYDCLYNLSR